MASTILNEIILVMFLSSFSRCATHSHAKIGPRHVSNSNSKLRNNVNSSLLYMSDLGTLGYINLTSGCTIIVAR